MAEKKTAMALDLKEREKKRELAELKEKISHFLYRQYIDFERDKVIKVNGSEAQPAFFLNKYGIIIECVRNAKPGDPDYDEKLKAYEQGDFKFLFMDMNSLASEEVDDFLKKKLAEMGCRL